MTFGISRGTYPSYLADYRRVTSGALGGSTERATPHSVPGASVRSSCAIDSATLPPMIPISEARRFVLSACGALTPRQMAVSDALGHVLAQAIRAGEAVPPFRIRPWTGTRSEPLILRIHRRAFVWSAPCLQGQHEDIRIGR